MITRWCVILLTVAVAGCGGGDKAKLKGKWQMQSFVGETTKGPEETSKVVLEIGDDKTTLYVDGKMVRERPFTVNPGAKPKEIDLVDSKDLSQKSLGIYELDGDNLKLCVSEGKNAKRPSEFKPDRESRATVLTFKRIP
jgi:uncharacterized protein (TIGR03067 family)